MGQIDRYQGEGDCVAKEAIVTILRDHVPKPSSILTYAWELPNISSSHLAVTAAYTDVCVRSLLSGLDGPSLIRLRRPKPAQNLSESLWRRSAGGQGRGSSGTWFHKPTRFPSPSGLRSTSGKKESSNPENYPNSTFQDAPSCEQKIRKFSTCINRNSKKYYNPAPKIKTVKCERDEGNIHLMVTRIGASTHAPLPRGHKTYLVPQTHFPLPSNISAYSGISVSQILRILKCNIYSAVQRFAHSIDDKVWVLLSTMRSVEHDINGEVPLVNRHKDAPTRAKWGYNALGPYHWTAYSRLCGSQNVFHTEPGNESSALTRDESR
ncbi:hypothetical protein B0J17DRAFT_624688 [Rhizoctonia solani]|nr:hypothetical protein B0J17DRAFT_624688 [Rhizoctonia solani]